MSGPSPVIVLEFNELTPDLMDRFIQEGHLPNFARLREQSTVAITDPEEGQDELDPWIQWVTVHTGVGLADHGVEKLGEADRVRTKTLGQLVADAGLGAWICGSMNLPGPTGGDVAFLPDPWNPTSRPRPSAFRAFSDFVRTGVQEHSNSAVRPSVRDAARFVRFLMTHGLSRATLRLVADQLVAERRGTRGQWARASLLDRFQWDLFRWQWDRQRPAFATFFSNSTAHYQHLYWRNLEPERFVHQPTVEEQDQFEDAVLHGYRQMDRIVGEATELADRDGATLMFCTGLSQQPYLNAEDQGGKFIYRPHRVADVIAALEIDGLRQVAPVMAEQFHLLFDDHATASAAAERLRAAHVNDEPAFSVRVVGNDVFTGCCIHHSVDDGARLSVGLVEAARFTDLFYRSDLPKSGFHHPDGMWWTRTGDHRTIPTPVSLRSIAPTVLAMLDLPIPETMASQPVHVGSG